MKLSFYNIRHIPLQDLINLSCLTQIVIHFLYLYKFIPQLLSAYVAFIPINILFIIMINNMKVRKTDLFIALIVIFLFLINTAFSASDSDYKYSSLLMFFNTFLIAALFNGIKALKTLYYFLVAINLWILVIGIKSGFDPNFGNLLLAKGSRNVVSAIITFWTVYYLFLCHKESHKINSVLIGLYYFNCIILFGRSGIAIASLIVIYTIYKKFGTLLSLLLAGILTLVFNSIKALFLEETNFSKGLDTPRLSMSQEYFDINNMSVSEYVLGRNFEQCCTIISHFDGNPHNAFILGHNLYGITHFLFFLIILVIIFLSKKIELIFFALIFIIRNFLDTFGFFSPLDIGFFAIFIYVYKDVINKSTKPM